MYIKPIKIGNLEIKNNIFLAPMAGVTDMPFRKLCKEYGAGLIYTEMASSKAVHYGSEKTKGIYEVFDEERPIGIQIFGSDADVMAETAEALSSIADIIDINMGCPANKIVKNGEGSALMKNLKLAEEIISKVVKVSKVPVTVKMRKGWDDSSINAVELAKIAENSGARLITVHGRTREQMYSGEADLDIIKKVKESVNIPVIGNGDITSGEKAKRMFEYTGCDGIMIARGAEGNPWIFRQVIEYLENGVVLPEPSQNDKIKMALRHLELVEEYKGENVAVREMRKHIAWYLKGIHGAAKLKDMINKEENIENVKEILNKSLNWG